MGVGWGGGVGWGIHNSVVLPKGRELCEWGGHLVLTVLSTWSHFSIFQDNGTLGTGVEGGVWLGEGAGGLQCEAVMNTCVNILLSYLNVFLNSWWLSVC